MGETCCGVVSENEESRPSEQISRAARRRRLEIRRVKFITGVAVSETENEQKRQKEGENAVENSGNCTSGDGESHLKTHNGEPENKEISLPDQFSIMLTRIVGPSLIPSVFDQEKCPKFGVASVCGRRRDMEDAVAIHLSFCRRESELPTELHYFGVYDGHGCSHVAMKCRDRLHELVKEELERHEGSTEWKMVMERSFSRMDDEAIAWNEDALSANCRCELQTPECDGVGSTAVVAIVTPDEIIVANCGDSRAVLCRSGKACPLSVDHKPDRPDELNRIQNAGGRVIYWDGPRVLGVLGMSRAIGDNYLKPYVSCEPEVTITERTAQDDCLILASDGLWDVVSNDTACSVARMCLRGKARTSAGKSIQVTPEGIAGGLNADKFCSDASMLLTKLALARRSADNVSVVVIDLRKTT